MNRHDFPILNEIVHKRPLVYLDNAATTQKPQTVIDAIGYGYAHFNANIHRGVHHLSQVATAHHEEARQHVARFINAATAEEVLFTKGTTDSLNMLAFSFGEAFVHAGDEIIVSYSEHHSNIVPWQMLCDRKGATLRVLPLCNDLTWDLEAFAALLSEKTRLVSVAHVSNVLGIINPIEEVIRLAHKRGIPVCIDGAQSVPHFAIDVQRLDCDFLVFSAHKMYGPTGLGVLYGKADWLNQLPPAQGGGEMIEHVSFQKTTYNTIPYKFEAGTPNYIGSYAFAVALTYMEQIGMERIAAHEHELAEYAEAQLSQIAGVHIYAEGQRKAGAISFNVYKTQELDVKNQDSLIHPYDIGMLLDQQGVAVRTGHHCAEPLIEYLGVPGTVRVSFGLYNDQADIDAFIVALRRAITMLQ